ncbi:MAG: arsenate reductase (glutaredoxin) [Gammaproteobacteria bacterium]|nr:arsenate reductase (glutaredoxin) [Gammaproteobacteria bacterium]
MGYPLTVIYHNPRCSKSRATLKLIQEQGIEPDIVLYLQDSPDAQTIRSITKTLNCSALQITRTSEALYTELGLKDKNLDEESMIKILAKNPSLLERPIVLNNGQAVIGRPPENVLTIL